MAHRLKDFYGASVVGRVADEIAAAWPAFARRAFVAEATRGLADLELLDRARHIAGALKRHLPPDPAEAMDVLVRSLPPPLEATEGHGMAPFAYLPHTMFVAEHGLACFEASMRAQHALTQRCSAEFSIRRFLEAEPARTLDVLREWTGDPSPHVRRLVSEGTRPRLPWAGRLRAFQADPEPTLALLERLKDDPHPYVRRSVANHLNDIGKDHPKLLVEVARRWMAGAPPARRQLVAHALRHAVKRGDAAALSILGRRGGGDVHVVRATCRPARPRIGDDVEIEMVVQNRGRATADVEVDLGIHFVKASGATAPKVFKLKAVRLAKGEEVRLRKRISLKQHTTRKHHAGRHAFDVRLNGRVVPAASFLLRG